MTITQAKIDKLRDRIVKEVLPQHGLSEKNTTLHVHSQFNGKVYNVEVYQRIIPLIDGPNFPWIDLYAISIDGAVNAVDACLRAQLRPPREDSDGK